jgi:hypothetical protein
MAYEYESSAGVVRLVRMRRLWRCEFAGNQNGKWRSPDAAATAVARHRSGLSDWDGRHAEAPHDLLDWRPLTDSL